MNQKWKSLLITCNQGNIFQYFDESGKHHDYENDFLDMNHSLHLSFNRVLPTIPTVKPTDNKHNFDL